MAPSVVISAPLVQVSAQWVIPGQHHAQYTWSQCMLIAAVIRLRGTSTTTVALVVLVPHLVAFWLFGMVLAFWVFQGKNY